MGETKPVRAAPQWDTRAAETIMRKNLGFIRTKYAILTLLAAGIVVAVWAFAPKQAAAQTAPSDPTRIFSSGFITLGEGETAGIGLLLPAVQKVRSAAHMTFRGPNGRLLFSTPLAGPSTNSNSFFDVFFDVTYHRAPSANVGVLVFKDGKTGEVLMEAPSPDGILIGLLVPAVQRNSNTAVPPAGASVQLFNATGGTTAFDSFFDITY